MTHPLVAALASPDADERMLACRLAVGDPSAVVLLEPLEAALGDPVARVAMAAADSFAAIGARDGSCDEALRRLLRSGPPNARWASAFAAARLAPPTARSLPALIEALACEDGAVRWRAARLLVDAASVLPEVGPVLDALAAAPDADPRARQMALHALRLLAPDEERAERAFLAAAGDPDPRIRRAAAAALAAATGAAAGPRLLEMAEQDTDDASARLAIFALASRNRRDPSGLPPETAAVLRRIVESDAPIARRAAAGRTLAGLAADGGRIPPPR